MSPFLTPFNRQHQRDLLCRVRAITQTWLLPHILTVVPSSRYGAGGVNGTAYKDTVTVGSATVSGQIIGSAGFLEGFAELGTFDGIRKQWSAPWSGVLMSDPTLF